MAPRAGRWFSFSTSRLDGRPWSWLVIVGMGDSSGRLSVAEANALGGRLIPAGASGAEAAEPERPNARIVRRPLAGLERPC
jgi:hypothetical protein